MEALKTLIMHCRLGSATLSQGAFPGEKQPEFRSLVREVFMNSF